MKYYSGIFPVLFLFGVAHADTSYTVTYSCGDGTGTPPENATAYENTSFTPATNSCSKTGHTFAGWGVSGTDDVVNEPFTWEYTENKTLTATWTPNTYNITLSNIPTLPAGYTQLEYLISDKQECIITNIEWGDVYKFNGRAQQTVVDSWNRAIFGSSSIEHYSMYGTYYESATATKYWYWVRSIPYTDIAEFNFTRYGNTNRWNGVVNNIDSGTGQIVVEDDDNVRLLCTGRTDRWFTGNVWYLRLIDEKGDFLLNAVPAKRNSDGLVGFYDLVSDQMLANSGTGTFIAGPIVPEVLTSNTQTYTYGVGNTVNSEPTRNGYTFAGWCMDAELQNCAMTQTIGTTDTGDKTYYAKWNGNVFNITWNGVDAADVAANNAGTMTYGENIRTPRVAPAERPGQVFLGWKFRKSTQQ